VIEQELRSVELGTAERQGGSCLEPGSPRRSSSEVEVAPRSWDDPRVGARGGRRVARHVWTPTASGCSSGG